MKKEILEKLQKIVNEEVTALHNGSIFVASGGTMIGGPANQPGEIIRAYIIWQDGNELLTSLARIFMQDNAIKGEDDEEGIRGIAIIIINQIKDYIETKGENNGR